MKTKAESLAWWADTVGKRMEVGHLAMLVDEFLDPYTDGAVFEACKQAIRDNTYQFAGLLSLLESGAAGDANAVRRLPGGGKELGEAGVPGWQWALTVDRNDYAVETWEEYLQCMPDGLMLWDHEKLEMFEAAPKARLLLRDAQNAGD